MMVNFKPDFKDQATEKFMMINSNKFFFNNKECTFISFTDLTSIKEVENLKD